MAQSLGNNKQGNPARRSWSDSSRRLLRLDRKHGFLFVLTAWVVGLAWLWNGGRNDVFRTSLTPAEVESRKVEVKNAFIDSWNAYKKYAWGYDRFHPVSKRGSQMSPNGLGWIIVDSLDTMMIMNLTEELADSRRWISRKLDYNQEQDVNVFETTIRMLGGLLSAHYLSTQLPDVSSRRDHIYLEKAISLADRLMGAYDSPSGIPFASVMLSTGAGVRPHADGGSSSTAEATTLQLEMKYLANLTGNADYWKKAERIMKVVDDNAAQDGLVPIFIDPQSGQFTSREIRLGSRGDSYYEYLLKQYLQTAQQEPIYEEMWRESLMGIEKHLIVHTKKSKLSFIAELPRGIGGPLSPKMDHLACFLPGAIALGATGGLTEAEARKLPSWNHRKRQDMRLARELTKACWGMYRVTETGLAPEIVWFSADEESLKSNNERKAPAAHQRDDSLASWKEDYQIKPLDAHNLQRPETLESLLIMWRITRDEKYREWGWRIFKAFQKHTVLDLGQGYTSLDDVTRVPPRRRDNMESFWLAETLKYLYLLFSPPDFLPLTEVVFNTEAHIFPIVQQGRFKTGWARKSR